MSAEIAIRARALGKVYRLYKRPEDRLIDLLFHSSARGRDFWALKDVDLEVRRGETVGIIGRNGSGKSTLLQLVCGTVQPTTGELEVRGRVAALLELGAGFNPEFTGRENVILSASVLGLSEQQIAQRFPLIEAFAEIGEFIDQPVRHYSSGMYARLAFAVCAHVDADILVIDEILGVGDAGFRQRCMRYFNTFRKRGTLLFVSHDAGAVVSLCDRAIWLDHGEVRAHGVTKDVCRRYHAFISGVADDSGAFQTGGEEVGSPAAETGPRRSAALAFAHDWVRVGPPMIEGAWLATAAGNTVSAIEAGDEVKLCIAVRAAREIEAPAVAFVLRDSLGQPIFADNTSVMTQAGPDHLPPGRVARATFRFRMPHLSIGEYAVEPMLFARNGQDALDRLLDSVVVRVNSHPFLIGLANAGMRRTTLTIGSGGAARELGGATPAARLPLIIDARWRGRNPMSVMSFRPNAPWHGHGGARIDDAGLLHLDGTPATRIEGGEETILRIRASAQRDLAGPIIGFMLRNDLGQNVFGENTFLPTLDADRSARNGETMIADFRFQMPYLPVGDYHLAPSIIDGTQQDHIHLHWMEEALTVRVIESPIAGSIVGVPMLDVRLELEPPGSGADLPSIAPEQRS